MKATEHTFIHRLSIIGCMKEPLKHSEYAFIKQFYSGVLLCTMEHADEIVYFWHYH